MIRCPNCRAANSEAQALCSTCGAALKFAPRPFFKAADWLHPQAALRALPAAALAALASAVALPALLSQSIAGMLMFHLLAGLGLGAAVAWAREEGWSWPLMGLAGAALSAALDFFYTGGFFVYKAVWHLAYWLLPDAGGRLQAKDVAYGLLQSLRLAGTGLVLGAFFASKSWKNPGLTLKFQVFFLLALAGRFFVRQFYVSLPWSEGSLVATTLYAASLYLMVYALCGSAPVDANSRK